HCLATRDLSMKLLTNMSTGPASASTGVRLEEPAPFGAGYNSCAEEGPDGRVELAVTVAPPFAERPDDVDVDRARIQFHVVAGRATDAAARHAEGGAVGELEVPRVDDPPGRRLAGDRAESERAVALGEVFGVGQAVHVDDECRGCFQCALAEDAARGRDGEAADLHGDVAASCEHVERVRIHEPAAVAAQVDDHAVAPEVFCIEVDDELLE